MPLSLDWCYKLINLCPAEVIGDLEFQPIVNPMLFFPWSISSANPVYVWHPYTSGILNAPVLAREMGLYEKTEGLLRFHLYIPNARQNAPNPNIHELK